MSISEVIQPFYTSAVSDLFGTYDVLDLPPLVILCQNLHLLDYKHRKFLLECSRVQKRIGSNKHLKSEYQGLSDSKYNLYVPARALQSLIHQEFLPRSYCVEYICSRKFCTLFNNFYDDPLSCALLSYLVRAESTDHLESFTEQLSIGLAKELTASQLRIFL